jgi:predicted ATPase/DNA-binding NarL/FixJ family response regulator
MPTSTPGSRQNNTGTSAVPGRSPSRSAKDAEGHISGERSAVAGAEARRSNLVLPRSPLVGRQNELAAVQSLLLRDAVALVTLTGPGGIGKTRLALQVGANLLDHFVDGVYFVSLAPIRDPDLVAAAIAHTLGVTESAGMRLQESLHGYLRERQLLLVLDNFEQLLGAASLVAELLLHCRRIKVLATSRIWLHLYDEHVYSVPPLALPPLEIASADPSKPASTWSDIEVAALATTAAVALFAQRAVEVDPAFVLSTANIMAVSAICIDLEGMPLALELAAAKLRLFSPPALLARLKQRLSLLTDGPHDVPERQRTLRNEIAWSYDLLAFAEQALFRRLAIFAGGFTLEAAQSVGDAEGDLGIDVLDGVTALLDHSLLKRLDQRDDEPRFGMLETIREYGLEQLAVNGETIAFQRWHAFYFARLAEAIAPSFAPSDQSVGLDRLLAEQANLQAVLAWCHDTESVDTAARLALAMTEFWMITGQWIEGRRWLEAILARTSVMEGAEVRAPLLVNTAAMAIMQGDYAVARQWLAEGLPLASAHGMRNCVAHANTALGWMAHAQGDSDLALTHLGEALAIHREADNKVHIASTLVHLAGVLGDLHDYTGAESLYAEGLIIFQALGIEWEVADVLHYLGKVALRQDEYRRAWALFRESLASWLTIGTLHWKGIPECLNGMAEICGRTQHFTAAARLLGATESLREYLGIAAHQDNAAAYSIATFDNQADQLAFTTASTEGRAFTPRQAVEYALALTDPLKSTPSHTLPQAKVAPGASGAGLTAREIEVLYLLVQGLTYAEIGNRLFVTRRTVNGHVTSIYSKLGVNNRTAAARCAAAHGIL